MKIYLTKKLNYSSNYSVLLVIFVTALVLLVRKTDALTNPQFWAEDGVIFFLQQYNNGVSALLQEYAGYLLLIPRLIALVADAFIPYAFIPVFYNYSSLLITLIVVMSVFSSRFHVKHKVLIALAISLVPNHANEVFLNITNLQWILSIMIIIVLFKENPNVKYGNVAVQYACDLSTIIICGLTGPFIILLMPFFGWKWIDERNTYNVMILTAVIIISLIQLSFTASASMNSADVGVNFSLYSAVIGHKMFGGLFLGSNISYKISPYILSLLYFGILTLILHLAYQKKNRFIFFCIGISLIYLLAAFYRSRNNLEDLILPGIGTRYFCIPYIMLTWSLIALLGQQEKWKNILLKVGLALILISSLTSGFHSKPFIDYNWPLYSKSIGKEDVVIPINPEGWQINVKAHTR